MRFLVDECVSGQAADELRRCGHDITWATEVCPGFDDEAMMAIAYAERRIVVSFDRGVGNRSIRVGRPAVGVVVVAPSVPRGELRAFAVSVAQRISALVDAGLDGKLTILERDRTRQRALPAPVDRA